MKSNLKILTILFLFSMFSEAQTKQERETRIDKNLLPTEIQTFINLLPKNTKLLRFYKETDGNKDSFEVKFKYNGSFYSSEFSTDGQLEDIEKLIKKRHIDASILAEIENYFDINFRKSKLLKIQKQFLPKDSKDDFTFLKSILKKETNTKTNYEIIAEVTKGKNRTLKEFLINSEGQFLNMRDIARSSYGHVLY